MPRETQTEQSKYKQEQCEQSKKQSIAWTIKQLGILAVALGESVTTERLRVYAEDLTSDLSQEQLQVAFTLARRGLKFFPKIAELRDLAGGKVEAEAAWVFATDYLRKWGVDLLPVYLRGELHTAPPIPVRIGYALRRIGGLAGLNQIKEETRHFMFRDFCEAYQQAPAAGMLAQLSGLFGEPKRLTGNATLEES